MNGNAVWTAQNYKEKLKQQCFIYIFITLAVKKMFRYRAIP